MVDIRQLHTLGRLYHKKRYFQEARGGTIPAKIITETCGADVNGFRINLNGKIRNSMRF